MSSRSRLQRLGARAAVTTISTALGLLVFACSDRDVNIGFGVAGDSGGGGVLLTPVDDAAAEAETKFTSYCPSSECPPDRTTCPTSRFRCDVDLKTDPENCGACGLACPRPTSSEMFACVDGRCVIACIGAPIPAQDCDGIPDNGCEIRDLDNDHCGACGNKCSDPQKPCVIRDGLGELGCGCPVGKTFCPPFPWCIDATFDDDNCGTCGNVCDPDEGVIPHESMKSGCYSGQCGFLKCKDNTRANCDGDLGNGCETSILTAENCGACGTACAPGQECRLDANNVPQCMCEPGMTFCSQGCTDEICKGECFDLTSDRKNCGACGASCASVAGAYSTGICSYGECIRQCVTGRADCNGNEADDCEVNTDNDPLNCGGCGNVCDAVAGQACVSGRCVVKPCDSPAPDAGEVTK